MWPTNVWNPKVRNARLESHDAWLLVWKIQGTQQNIDSDSDNVSTQGFLNFVFIASFLFKYKFDSVYCTEYCIKFYFIWYMDHCTAYSVTVFISIQNEKYANLKECPKFWKLLYISINRYVCVCCYYILKSKTTLNNVTGSLIIKYIRSALWNFLSITKWQIGDNDRCVCDRCT